MKKVMLFLAVVVLAVVFPVRAQEVTDSSTTKDSSTSSITDLAAEYIKISGDVSANGELYSVSGKTAGRPAQSGRLSFRPSISLWDKVNINFDLFVSTEGSGARQEINTMKFNPEWSWGRFYYGDFSLQTSKFVLTDVNINGYGLELFPGILKFAVVTGKTQKAIIGDAATSMYERTLYGGKLGLGDEGGTHFHINFMRAYDNINSLSRNLFQKIDTVSVAGGGTRIDTNYTGVTPSENLIAGSNWGFSMFNKAFKFKGEAAVSIFTQDMYSSEVENKDVPKEVSKYYTPRLTTSGDIAFDGEMSINTRPLSLKGGYTYVGPGYTSLGMGSLINDKQIIKGSVGMNLFEGNFNLNTTFQQQSDNVAKQKLFTTERNMVSVMMSVKPSKSLMFSFMTNMNKMGNNATNQTIKIDITASSMAFNSTYTFEGFGAQNSLSAAYSTQNSESKSAVRGNTSVKSNNMQFGLNTMYTKQLSSNIAVALSKVDLGSLGSSGTNTVTGRVGYKLFDDKLNSGLTYSRVSADASTSNVVSFQASYQLFQASSVSFQSRGTFFKGKAANSLSFNEFTHSLDWSYRF